MFLFSMFGATKLLAQDTSPQFIQGIDTLVVYKDVPGLVRSDKYTIRVRSAATNNVWVDVFANYTYNRALELVDIPRDSPTGSFLPPVTQGYAKPQGGWSNTYGNIEMNNGQVVEVEIAAKDPATFKIGGQVFFKAKVHPEQKASAATLVDGKIYFTITKPGQIYIDINGQMDDYNATINPIGHPIHAVFLWANPVIKKPSLLDSRTQVIEPGTTLTAINAINPADYDVMYFKPGVHDLGSGIKMYPGKSIYIPGDAFIYGTFNNNGVPKGTFSTNGENITVYGYGTISGSKVPHYQYAYYYPEIVVDDPKPLSFENPVNSKLFGVTTVDGANHTVEINGTNNSIKWLKTMTWRTNGDGIGGYTDAEDCFIRSHDDNSYIKASKRRCTFWKDNNARLFFMATTPENTLNPIIIEDCDVLYARLRTNPGINGGGFTAGGLPGQRNVNVIIRNIRFHDKLINMSVFNLQSDTGSSFDGVLFQNISIAGMAPGNRQKILGSAISPWYGGLIFDNLTIGGTLVTLENHTNYFDTNEFVKDIWFKMPEYYSIKTNVNPLQGTISFATTDTTRFAIRTTDNTYMEKSTVVFTATAVPGYKFKNWSGDVVSTSNPVSVEMDSIKNITADFEYIGFKTLTVSSSGNGTVVTNPTGINHSFNSIVTITAKPAIGYKFNGWSGDSNNQDIITTILMDTDKTVTANFVKTNNFAINYGGDQYIATDGVVYAAGSTQAGTSFSTTTNISNTTDPILYQSEKFGSALTYAYPVDNGKYSVTLKFAELSSSSSAIRRFNILLEGIEMLNNFHLSNEAGGNFTAIDKTYQTTVSDGNLTINLNRVSSSTNNAKINAIQITRIPEITPVFDAPVAQYCYGETLSPLPTTSNNGIVGSWSPGLNNVATTTYTFTPTAGQYATTTTLTLVIGGLTTWNGTSWDNGLPNATTKAIIAGNYSSTANFNACSFDIINSAIVVVSEGFNFTIGGKINVAPTANFTLQNNTNLIQFGNSQNEGIIIVKRNSSPLKRLDYTLWSSPVDGQQLQGFSPETLSNRFYVYNPNTNLYNSSIPTNNFAIGKGYLIRTPNTHPETPTIFNGNFTGIPNNGTIAFTVTNNSFNAIGNPYPSSINANAFIDANALIEPLYFWRKTNNAANTSYATYTKAGGAANSGGLSSIEPNGIIQVGQGFIAKSTSTSFIFNNTMRIANNDNQFLKTKAIERHRIWLNLSKESEPINQMMVAYMSGATAGIDPAIDGRFFGDSATALNSSIENQEFVIQAKGLPFVATDVVPLSFKTSSNGSFNISIDHVDGIFAGNQDIFLRDNLVGLTQNLKEKSYSFASLKGIFNNRFELVYKNTTTLGLESPNFNSNSVLVFQKDKSIYIDSSDMEMKNIIIYDILGRKILEKLNTNKTSIKINLKVSQQVLVLKITNQNNVVVTKKIVY